MRTIAFFVENRKANAYFVEYCARPIMRFKENMDLLERKMDANVLSSTEFLLHKMQIESELNDFKIGLEGLHRYPRYYADLQHSFKGYEEFVRRSLAQIQQLQNSLLEYEDLIARRELR